MDIYQGYLYIEGSDRVVICSGGSANIGRHSAPGDSALRLIRDS